MTSDDKLTIEVKYSNKEIKLLLHFVSEALLINDENALQVYRIASVLAFIENENSKYADSLRRCMRHLESGKLRFTPEFDALIDLE